ncbi:hypothetical protein F4778DRAFT_724876 [Xylariomycetidae sp. FL2044]|nr:hypothetical protein F4778DRAFT_724876 [Xylariomycetidae sp. FL2044]
MRAKLEVAAHDGRDAVHPPAPEPPGVVRVRGQVEVDAVRRAAVIPPGNDGTVRVRVTIIVVSAIVIAAAAAVIVVVIDSPPHRIHGPGIAGLDLDLLEEQHMRPRISPQHRPERCFPLPARILFYFFIPGADAVLLLLLLLILLLLLLLIIIMIMSAC